MSQDDILLDIAPEMSSTDPAMRARFLGYAAGQLGQVYGTNQDLATAYMAAHMLTMRNRGANAEAAPGATVQLRTGDTQQAFSPMAAAGALDATVYGVALKSLSRQYTFLPLNRMMDA